jgi:DNA-binding transcriptional LysR family regulator
MELRELRYFLAVYETGSVTAAARRCYISQPSISTALASLERELGAVLFVRHRKGAAPTTAADTLYERARRLVDETLALKGLFANSPAPEVTLGLMRSLDIKRVGALLKALARDGDIRLSVVDPDLPCDARIISSALLRETEVFAPLWSERYVLALPARHPLRLKPRLMLADLEGLPLIARCHCENASQTADLGFQPWVTAIATTEEWALALVEAGVGATVLPEGVIPSDAKVAIRDLGDLGLTRDVGLAYRRADAGSPAVTHILTGLGLGKNKPSDGRQAA